MKEFWYPMSPVMYNETRSKTSPCNWRDCIIHTGKIVYKPYDPYDAIPGMPTEPEGDSRQRKAPKTSGKWVRWTPEMDNILIQMRNRGETHNDIANAVGVPVGGVMSRCGKLKYLGLITFSGRKSNKH